VSILFLPHNSQGVQVLRFLSLPVPEVSTCVGSSDVFAVPVLRRGFWVASGVSAYIESSDVCWKSRCRSVSCGYLCFDRGFTPPLSLSIPLLPAITLFTTVFPLAPPCASSSLPDPHQIRLPRAPHRCVARLRCTPCAAALAAPVRDYPRPAPVRGRPWVCSSFLLGSSPPCRSSSRLYLFPLRCFLLSSLPPSWARVGVFATSRVGGLDGCREF